ncbi:Di-sulfide bridge nucleocytoplasmic transport domain-containing protein [Xylogone sp. PMI_703]|nr:Di-sulfide bridge nucleocytoplasmic transport domain-containing protein [Xylogone sp. PMI_703]
MEKRSYESPMDWEWQTQAPTDPNSPFLKFKPSANLQKTFETPSKSSSFINSSSTTAPPFRNPSFTTPRKQFEQDILSEVSGAESSPADNADGEDTPDIAQSTKSMTHFKGSPLGKGPLFGRYGANTDLMKKVRKRQRITRSRAAIRGNRGASDDESVDGDSGLRSKSNTPKEDSSQGWLSALLTGIESRPNLPSVLSYYAQLILNFFLVFLTIYGIMMFWSTIRADVDKASEEAKAAVVAEMVLCAKEYVDNKCAPETRVRAMEAVCNNWEQCMSRDPDSVGRARISARTFAEIFNSFIEPISIKAMIFVVLILATCILVNNLAFGMFRSKHTHPPSVPQYFPPQPQQFQWGPPQTPSHSIGFDPYTTTPFPQIMASQIPNQHSPSKRDRSPTKGNRSPSKGRIF